VTAGYQARAPISLRQRSLKNSPADRKAVLLGPVGARFDPLSSAGGSQGVTVVQSAANTS
jgi:hypothetical protein